MDKYQDINSKIQKGYEMLYVKKDEAKACDEWLSAWDEIKVLFAEGEANDINEMDKKYNWTEPIFNYVQDLEQELHNAGCDEKDYYFKRITYCQELLQWCGNIESIEQNTKRAMAESYFETGDTATCDQLFGEWLKEDPQWGYGYIGWSDCYRSRDNTHYEKAEAILLSGYAQEGLHDKADVVDRMVTLYEDMGQPEKAKEYKREYTALQRIAPEGSHHYKATPVVAEKIGRNEPCPCGSGQKYKRCCGA